MRNYLQFITTPTADTPGTTLLLQFDNKRYLFGGLSEGVQRACIEQGVRLLKLSDVFITGRTEWRNVGGLLGMILTLADAGASSLAGAVEDQRKRLVNKAKQQNGGQVDQELLQQQLAEFTEKEKPRLALHGTRNLNYLMATARRFIFRQGMPLTAHESVVDGASQNGEDIAQKQPFFQDDNIKVWSVCVAPEDPTSSSLNRAKSPRKRSFDQMHERDTSASPSTNPPEDLQTLVKDVVHHMFDSDWRRDALFEQKLRDQINTTAQLFVRQGNQIQKYTGPIPDGKNEVPDITVLIRKPWPGAMIEALPPTQPAKEAVSYIVRNHPQRGKFDPKKAESLAISDKKLYSQLTHGESVQNDNGETITPEMVMGPSRVGGGAAIIDIPSVDYVQPLISRPEWASKELMLGVGVFIWNLGPGVATSPALKQFMEQHSECKHIISSPETGPNRLHFDSVAESTVRLSTVDPARYILPYHNNTPWVQLPEPFVLADRGLVVDLEPAVLVKPQPQPYLDEAAIKAEVSPEVAQVAALAHDDIEKDQTALTEWANKVPQGDSEIITLGTGSALPSKYRNVSATLVRIPSWGNILLDCGENTLGQLKRVLPPYEFDNMLKDLRMIWISHMHADHHLGTVSVIRAWYETVHGAQPSNDTSPASSLFNAYRMFGTNRLAVVSDAPMIHWLWEYSQVEDYGYSRLAPLEISRNTPSKNQISLMDWFSPPDSTAPEDPLAVFERPSEKTRRRRVPASLLNLSDIQAVGVNHCHGARAVSITLPSGFKVSYSGDCRPSWDFVSIGQNSTVCIHEATFDDELSGDALAKRHSTTSEALGVASKMNAKACVLTHFSQRYQKVPVLEYTEDGHSAADAVKLTTETENTDADDDDDVDMAPNTDTAIPDEDEETRGAEPGPAKTTVKLKAGTDMKVCVAFDYMRVKVGEIAQMEKFTPALLELFADEERRKAAEKEKRGGNTEKEKGKGKKGGAEKKEKSKRNN
ncbi:hypothetical protein MBLNU457_g0030t1 [Dothideomycetes sp. NU457]